MTHDQLRALAIRVLKRSPYRGYGKSTQVGFRCGVVLSELVSAAGDIPDAIGWSYGSSVMIECKTSRKDFLADKNKPQRANGTGAGERRYFMCLKGLLKPSDLPKDWGLLEVDGTTVTTAVSCECRVLDVAGHQAEKRMLLSTVRRIRTREFLFISAEHLEATLERGITDAAQAV